MYQKTQGHYHFFDVEANVTIGSDFYQVWAHLSAQYTADVPSQEVTYNQVAAAPGLTVVCSVGFMWNDPASPQPKNFQVFVGPPLSPGRCQWEQLGTQWRIDCPVSTFPTVTRLANLAKEMILAVMAPSWGVPASAVKAKLTKSRFLYFNPNPPNLA